jgi:hypothetical protein
MSRAPRTSRISSGTAGLTLAGLVRIGRLDPDTQRALRRLQAASALPETGLPGYATVQVLGLNEAGIFRRAPAAPREERLTVGP